MRPGGPDDGGKPAFLVEPCRRYRRRDRHRAADPIVRVAFKPTSSILTPVETITRAGVATSDPHDQGTPRPVRRHPRRAGGGGDGRAGARRSEAAAPRADRPVSAAPDRAAVRIVVHGKVQGVWFRAWLVEQARALGLDGWVRNRGDGTVEALAAGPHERLDALIARCREGSPASRVERVEIDRGVPADGIEGGFTQRPTG